MTPGITFDSSSLHLLSVILHYIILQKLSILSHFSIHFLNEFLTNFLLKHYLWFLNCFSTSVLLKFSSVHPIYTMKKWQWFPSIFKKIRNPVTIFQVITYSGLSSSIPIYPYFRALYILEQKKICFLTVLFQMLDIFVALKENISVILKLSLKRRLWNSVPSEIPLTSSNYIMLFTTY